MAESHTYDGGDLTTVRRGTVEYRLAADHMGEGGGTVVVDDDAGTIEIVGQKDWEANQDDCATPLLFRGFVTERTYSRSAGINRAPPTGASRGIEVSLTDTNSMAGFLLISGEDGNRPRETIAARATWLLASDYVSGLFSDLGRCSFSSSIEMTKSDYRNQYPGDVIADMALAQTGGVNYHINDYGDGPELTFRNDNTSTDDSCTLRVSNVMADQDGSTLYPFKDATLTRSPADVYSKVAFSYAKATVYEERTATATAFNGERDGQASNSNVNTAAASRIAARDLLVQHSTEEDIIECTVLATSAQVNLMPPGWRIQAKFSHLNTEGYGSFTWFRILEVTKKDTDSDGTLYEVRLKLTPQKVAPTPSTCAGLYPDTPAGIYYPLGGPNPCCTPYDVGTNIAYYFRSGWPEPWFPQPEYSGQFHYPTYGIGGEGTRDTFASGFGNILKFIVVGSGTLIIQTSQWAGQSQPYTISVWSNTLGTPVNSGTLYTGIAGDSTEVEITSDTDDCIHVIDLRADARSSSYIGMGWAQAEWVPA